MIRDKKNKWGFTLIELLAAIVILALIVIMAVPQISNMINSNSKSKFKTYAKMIETSAKLYTDAYNEDMFGNSESGCYDIKFNQMEEKKLLEDINMNNITCNGGNERKTFVRVYKSGEHYKYKVSILCTNKNNETSILYSDLIEEETDNSDICNGTSTDETGPIITLSSPPANWITGKDTNGEPLTTKITITDDYGLLENITIRYMWTTDINNIQDSNWTEKNFRNKRYAEKTTATLKIPQEKTGIYYLIVEPKIVKDANGNSYTGSNIISEPYKLDNTSPIITTTTNSSNGNWSNSNVTITATSTDNGSGVEKIYYGTTSSESSITTPLTLTDNVWSKIFTTEMQNTIYVMAVDYAGNKSDVVSVKDVKIDKTQPTCNITLDGTKNGSDYTSEVKVMLNKNDKDKSGIVSYGLTTSPTTTYNSTTSATQKDAKNGVTWYGYVKDGAGNTGSCDSGKFTVKLRTIPEFNYEGSYEIVSDDDTVINDIENYNGNWKIRFLTSGKLTITNLYGAANGIDVFLVGGGGNGGDVLAYRAGNYGYAAGGGGGGGGYRKTQRGVSISKTSYYIKVANQGETSEAFGYSAAGGTNGGIPKCLSACDSTCAASPGTGGANGGYGEVNACGWNVNGQSGGYEFDGSSGRLYGAGGGGGHGHNGGGPRLGYGGSGGAGGGGSGNREYYGLNTHNATTNTGSGGGGASYVLTKTIYSEYSSQGYTTVEGTIKKAGKGASGIVIIRNKR